MSGYSTSQLYQGVIDDLIHQVKESFLDEGADIDTLRLLKKSWELKVNESGALDYNRNNLIENTVGVLPDAEQKRQNQRVQPKMEYINENIEKRVILSQPQSSGPLCQPVAPYKVEVLIRRETPSAGNIKNETGHSLPQLNGGLSLPNKCETELNRKAPGMTDSSSEEEQDDHDTLNRNTGPGSKLGENSEEMEDSGEGSPLNSDDDLSDEEDVDTIFKSENVVVCQFEKVIRVKNKWKFQLLHGIAHINHKDSCFEKSTAEAEW